MNILITGATGLLGKAFLEEFTKEYSVTGVHRKNSILPSINPVSWLECDLEQPDSFLEAIPKYDCVIHAAAKVSFDTTKKQEIIDFNLESTKEIVNTCLEHGVKLVFVSSVAALGSTETKPVSEQDDFDLNAAVQTDYALSKHLSEMEVWRGISEGLQAIIINPSIILGIPSSWKESTGGFWTRISNGLNYFPGGSTGFVDARDVALATRLLLENKQFGERFILNGANASYETFFRFIHHSLSLKTKLKPLRKSMSSMAWRLAQLSRLFGQSPKYSKALHETINKNIQYDNAKVKAATGIEFRELEESIKYVSNEFLSK